MSFCLFLNLSLISIWLVEISMFSHVLAIGIIIYLLQHVDEQKNMHKNVFKLKVTFNFAKVKLISLFCFDGFF